MARLIFPDEGSRLVYSPDTGALLTVGTRVYLYLDSGATQPATDLLNADSTPNTLGYVQLDAFRRMPLFSGPDALDTLYAIVNGGPITPVYARTDDRIDGLAARVTTLETSTPANLTAEANTRAAADAANTTAITNEVATARAAEAGKVAKAGDTMTGPLALPGNPTLPLQAAPKQYADSGDSATLSSAQTYTDGKVTALVNGAPGILDTLGEIATQLQSDESAAGALTTAVAGKAQKLVRTAVKTGAYAAAAGDLVPCDTTSGAFTVTLPNAPAVGTRVAVKIVTLGTGNFVTIACAGSDVYNKAGGATTAVLQLLGHAMNLQYDTGGIWTVVADDVPKSQLDGTYLAFLQAAMNPDLIITGAITRDANGAATSAPVVWPDGTAGTYTADTVSVAFPGSVDAYHVTYGSPATKTYTQSAVTRAAATGAVTNRPAITVA